MNRRRFLLRLAAFCSLLFGGGALVFARHPHCGKVSSYSDLPADLQKLYFPDFVHAFPDLTLDDLFTGLRARRVCTQAGFDIAQVRDNAAADSLVQFGNFFWTESELMLYALIARLHENAPAGDSTRSRPF